MAEPDSCVWSSASGKQHTYWIYPIPANLNSGQDGNYIYAMGTGRSWQPIYIGPGDLGDRSDMGSHHQSVCLKRKGATQFHARKNPRDAHRRAEEKNLLAAHPEAYKPTGCNEKEGG